MGTKGTNTQIMKNFRCFTAILLTATMFISFNACSDDDDNDSDKKENLIIGKWKASDTDIIEFKANGSFEYSSTETGKWKIEGDKLYFLYENGSIWWVSKIHELNSTSLVLEEYEDDNTTLSGDKESYQRVN